jgi:ABC-type multidrug transport system fused ATPase/permease subunit
MNSDRILVMSDGQIAEFDTPQQLIDNQMLFYQLYTQAQNNADM